MVITAIYIKKDTKYCSLPGLKHIDTCSHLILVIFQRKPFSNSLKHGVVSRPLASSSNSSNSCSLFVHPLTLDVVLRARNRPAVNRQNQNSAKKQERTQERCGNRSYNGGIFPRRKRTKAHDKFITTGLPLMQ